MPSSKDKKDEVRKKTSTKKAAPVSSPKAKMPARKKVFTFEQWAKRRGVPKHHKGGLRAYVQHVHKPRTLEEWDKCFRDY
jgi:hypothetical protein